MEIAGFTLMCVCTLLCACTAAAVTAGLWRTLNGGGLPAGRDLERDEVSAADGRRFTEGVSSILGYTLEQAEETEGGR